MCAQGEFQDSTEGREREMGAEIYREVKNDTIGLGTGF